ncbi:MAG TPA: D-arabinono-1,4-lactone oxidase [Thermoleophilaceae bacterium]|nr:D-arabinono-1,4-lactone oxidase [Thermoleophilaceae bacterium]
MPAHWRNWAGDQTCAPERLERPDGEEELAGVLRRATEAGQRVRVAGAGHSFTDIACTDHVMVDLSRMKRVLRAEGDLVTVQAGIRLRELAAELAERGLALENQGDIDLQTLAGAVATATHGTGARFPNLSAQIAGMTLLTAAGERVEVDEGSEELLAARVNLGALGVVSELTVRCVPLFSIRRVDEPRPLRAALERFEEVALEHDHFELFAFPYTDTGVVLSSERGDFEPRPPRRARAYVQEVLIENRLLGAAFRLGRRFPRLIPAVNRGLARAVSRTVRTDLSHRVYANRRDVRFTEMEYALPREHGGEAARRVLDLIERRRMDVGFPIEVRVARGDDAYLSTAHGRDTAYIAVHQYVGMQFEGYFRAVESIMREYGGRPHWGKRHYRTAADLRELYPDWDRFQAVRERLDPGGRFSNDYTDRVLGPVTGSSAPRPGRWGLRRRSALR